MASASDYAVVRDHDGNYRINRNASPFSGTCALVTAIVDRRGAVLGWKLKPLVCMQGSQGKVWPSAADAIASSKLMTIGQAQTAITTANATGHAP